MLRCDVIVVGGGHAGTEACAAAARCGAQTVLVSFDPAKIGAMSCNPSIGGLGKGHLVREVDAFDGLIGRATDRAGIHYRMLNRSKGTAVQGPRVQADRRRYAHAIQQMLVGHANLRIVAGEAAALILENGVARGLILADGRVIHAQAVVLATGTFLGGRMFRGRERIAGGRAGEASSSLLAQQLRTQGLPMARLKTGTPPRLDGRTIAWAELDRQPSDTEPWTMSPRSPGRTLPQVHCAITRTTVRTHDIIRAGLDDSPLFSGAIAGPGPRYCPSIEDKIDRFGDREGHQVFLEPEGLDDPTVYPNGLSTSLSTEVQQAIIASIPGLERSRITMPGYAVEYDHIDPRALSATLEVRAVPRLFCCGQINGTTGYEEAAGQGLVAGINAAARAGERDPLILDRMSSYLGVMIDDLVLQGITEPYRMLTARAEYRLHLRADNAETRLAGIAERVGCLGDDRRKRHAARSTGIARARAELSKRIPAAILARRGAPVAESAEARTGADWLRVAGVKIEHILAMSGAADDPALLAEVAEDMRYAPYLERQNAEIAAMRGQTSVTLERVAFAKVPGLSSEMVERLSAARPVTIGEASRIRGITPAALTAILLQARRAA